MKFHTQLDKNYFRSVVFASVYCIMGIYQVPGSPWDQIGVIVVERMFNYSLITVDVDICNHNGETTLRIYVY